MHIIIELGSSNDSFLHRTSEQEEVMNDTCGCCFVVFRTISSWVLVLCFILGIVSGDSKPFHRWSWHRVDHMASRQLLEYTFVVQPSVQGSPPSSIPAIISFELRPTSSASASTDIAASHRHLQDQAKKNHAYCMTGREERKKERSGKEGEHEQNLFCLCFPKNTCANSMYVYRETSINHSGAPYARLVA